MTALTHIIGFAETPTKREAIAYARGFAEKRFEALDETWYGVHPFASGFLYELKEGGDTKGALPDLVSILEKKAENDEVIARSESGRIVSITVENDRPSILILPESTEVEDTDPRWVNLTTSGKLRRLRPRGWRLLIAGIVFLGLGVSAFGLSFAHYMSILYASNQVPRTSLSDMPHRQWNRLVTDRPSDKYVGALRYRDGEWSIEWNGTDDESPSTKEGS